MIELARKKRAKKIFGFGGHVYAFDSTTIDLCLELFEWAKFRTTKGGVKIHTLLDVETQVPSFLLITEAKMNDVKAMDFIPYETSSYYVFDRAYNDFERLARIDSMGCFFIIRARRNSMTSRPYGGILRCGREADIHVPYKFEQDICKPGCRTVQEPVASGIVLQVAKTAPENQEVLGHVGKFREDSDPCSHHHLLPRCDSPPRHEIESFSLRNSPDFRNFADRQGPTSGTSDCKKS